MRGWKGLAGVTLLLSLVCWTQGCGGSGRADGDTEMDGDGLADGDLDTETDGDIEPEHECPSVFDGCYGQSYCRGNAVWICHVVPDEFGCLVDQESRYSRDCGEKVCIDYSPFSCTQDDTAICVDPAGPQCDSAGSEGTAIDVSDRQALCTGLVPQYLDPDLMCGHQERGYYCSPITVSFGNLGQAVVCETTSTGTVYAIETPSWLGPGYGCVWGPDTYQVITGWYAGVGGYGDPCHDRWTAESIARVLKRSPPDPTPCETITDYETCLATHNHPYHCMAVYGWPFEKSGDGCRVRGHLDRHGDELEEARFIGCRTVREPFNHPDNIGWRPHVTYQGPLKHPGTGECVGFADLELAIPDGWEKVACGEECCTGDATCPEEEYCTLLDLGNGFFPGSCQPGCRFLTGDQYMPDNCGPGRYCEATSRHCLPGCSSDTSCPYGRCDLSDHSCTDDRECGPGGVRCGPSICTYGDGDCAVPDHVDRTPMLSYETTEFMDGGHYPASIQIFMDGKFQCLYPFDRQIEDYLDAERLAEVTERFDQAIPDMACSYESLDPGFWPEWFSYIYYRRLGIETWSEAIGSGCGAFDDLARWMDMWFLPDLVGSYPAAAPVTELR